MRFYTAHTRGPAPPILLREGFSLGAFLFGPLWLALHRAWVAAFASALAATLILWHTTAPAEPLLLLALATFLGLEGRDCERAGFARRGYELAAVLAARDAESALARFIAVRPELAATLR